MKPGIWKKRGNKPDNLTVDRIDRNEGYHIWNIQTLTHKENSDQGADNTPRAERADTDDQAEAALPPETEDQPF